MQRQSLGSPGREGPVLLDDAVLRSDDSKRRDSSSGPSFSVVDDEIKPKKPNRFGSYRPESFIHLIPVLIVFCFLVLYLSSHDPSPHDLAQFHGLKSLNHKHPKPIIEMKDIDEIGRNDNKNKEVKKSGGAFVMIRNQRNLQEEIIQRDIPKSHHPSHRKLGHF